MTDDRKRDTRHKIALGGIVIKAGLGHAERAFLLGVLIEAGLIPTGSTAHTRLTAIGRKAFATSRAEDKGAGDTQSQNVLAGDRSGAKGITLP